MKLSLSIYLNAWSHLNKISLSCLIPVINLFFWICLSLGKPLTTKNLLNKGILCPTRCVLFKENKETSSQRFLDFPFTALVWNHILSELNLSFFSTPCSSTRLF